MSLGLVTKTRKIEVYPKYEELFPEMGKSPRVKPT